MISMLDSRHQARLLKKWAPIIESGKAIESDYTKLALAQVLENTRNDFARHGLLNEAGPGMVRVGPLGDAPGDKADGKNGALYGKYGMDNRDTADYGNFFLPNVVMPMLRRIFPDLIANELVGVQPLNGPIGYALAFRAKYNNDGYLGEATGSTKKIDGTSVEIGYNSPLVGYTGISTTFDPATSPLTSDLPTNAWNEYIGGAAWTGEGAGVDVNSEYASLADGSYPTVGFDLIKTGVEAKTRKLGAQWSNELAEDMEAMHGIDVESEMVNLLSYEIGAEIDRQILTEMVKAAITGGSVSEWTPISADGLDQMGRLQTLLTQITIEANQIALRTRRGNANFAVASPKVTALLEQMSLEKFVSFSGGKAIPSVPYSGVGAIQKQGLINDGQQLLVRDAYSQGNYVLLGYKGTHPGDSGIIYCPYIPVQLSKVQRWDTFTPAIGARTRYGVMNSPWDAGRYYHFMRVADLETSYSWSGQRQFIAPTSTLPAWPL